MEDINNIIAGCLKEKRWAQQVLYKHYVGLMYGICLRYTGNKVDAEDVMQDGFIKIFENIRLFRNEGSFEGWMKRIMINTALCFLRQKTKNQLIYQQTEIADIVEDDNEIENDIPYIELMNIIQKLPEGARMVFNMYAIEEYSHKEISELLGISEGTSKSQLSRARKTLAFHIEKLKKNNVAV